MVYLANDEELHREVALKEIKGEHAHDRESRSRFLQEAEITGRLEHPGIIPVYGLGTYDDGRPFYAMRFIKGDNLKDAIEQFHAADLPGRDPGERELAFRELLRRFIDVCNAVAYAHSRGILHRDLKPNNIMLGPYGQTLVVDWGLAKPVGRPKESTPAPEETLRISSADSGSETRPGSAMGTPAYMSPEQAAGELDRLGPASDVYSLGATFYTVLTGKSPFEGADLTAALGRVKRGEFPPPGQLKRGIDPALEAACLKAMALRPEDRYATAGALADDIEHWLAGEPVAAWREPWARRMRRWARRHKPLVAGAAVMLAAVIAGVAIGTLMLKRANERIEARRLEAQRGYAFARRAVERSYTQVSNRLLNKRQMEPLRKELLDLARQFYQELVDERRGDPQAQADLGDALLLLSRMEQSIGSIGEAIARAEQARTIFIKLADEHPEVPAYRSGLAESHGMLGSAYERTDDDEKAEAAHTRSMKIWEELTEKHPEAAEYGDALAGSLDQLGVRYIDSRRWDRAEAALDRALKLREKLADEHPEVSAYRRRLADSLNHLGGLYHRLGRMDEAESLYQRALDHLQTSVDEHPGDVGLRLSLAETYRLLGVLRYLLNDEPERGEAFLQHALGILRPLHDDHPDLVPVAFYMVITYENIYVIKRKKQDIQGEHDCSTHMTRLLEGILRREPSSSSARELLLKALPRKNMTSAGLGRYAEAISDCDRAIEVLDGKERDQVRVLRAAALARSGDHVRASVEADRLADATPSPDGEQCYNLACAFALASAAARNDPQPGPPGRPQRSEQLAARALSLLGRSRGAGYFNDPANIDLLWTDDDLASLRSLPDFQLLRMDLAMPTDPFARGD